MTHVVCEPCINCKYTDCVAVCPVECFYEGVNMLAIRPEECIDCTHCVEECPAEAIFAEGDVPPQWDAFIQLNARLAAGWPRITNRKRPMGHHAAGRSRLELLDERPSEG